MVPDREQFMASPPPLHQHCIYISISQHCIRLCFEFWWNDMRWVRLSAVGISHLGNGRLSFLASPAVTCMGHTGCTWNNKTATTKTQSLLKDKQRRVLLPTFPARDMCGLSKLESLATLEHVLHVEGDLLTLLFTVQGKGGGGRGNSLQKTLVELFSLRSIFLQNKSTRFLANIGRVQIAAFWFDQRAKMLHHNWPIQYWPQLGLGQADRGFVILFPLRALDESCFLPLPLVNLTCTIIYRVCCCPFAWRQPKMQSKWANTDTKRNVHIRISFMHSFLCICITGVKQQNR